MRYLWMPRLVERIQAATTTSTDDTHNNVNMTSFQDDIYQVNPIIPTTTTTDHQQLQTHEHGFINPNNIIGRGAGGYYDSYGAFINQVSPIPDLIDDDSTDDHFIAPPPANSYNFPNSSSDNYQNINIHGYKESCSVNPNPANIGYDYCNNVYGQGDDQLMDYGDGDVMHPNSNNKSSSDEWMMMMMQNGDVSDYNLWNVDDFLFNNSQQQQQHQQYYNQQQQFTINNCAQNY